MTEYWLISAPGDKTCQQTWETLNNVTSKQNNLSVNYKFHIPDLKVSIHLEFNSSDFMSVVRVYKGLCGATIYKKIVLIITM